MPKLGDERFVLETISQANMETLAKANGWDGGDSESVRDYCEPEEAAQSWVFKTLKEAEEAAKKFLATGAAAYGCCLIDRQVFERPHIDGKLIGVPAAWERQQTYEIAMDGETMAIER